MKHRIMITLSSVTNRLRSASSSAATLLHGLRFPSLSGTSALNVLRSASHGLFSTTLAKSTSRIRMAMLGFGLLYIIIAGRLIMLGVGPDLETVGSITAPQISTARPDIVDRNGAVLATDVKTFSIVAEPRHIIEVDDAVERINAIFPELDGSKLRESLSSKRGFAWIKREVTPAQAEAVHRLGLPGIAAMPENKRVYPNGAIAAHVLGYANIDNIGIAGIEKWIDNHELSDLQGAGFNFRSSEMQPIRLSLDIRVTHAMRDELQKGMEKFKAKAAAGTIIDVNTGEVIAAVSLPDYDPNGTFDPKDETIINRLQVGVYEMGSTFKALTTAMALDSGKVALSSRFDARAPLRYGRHTINDFHPQRRILSVPEVFLHSSNIGTARMALAIGVEGHKAFLKKLGQLDPLITELAERSRPIIPAKWAEINTVTISFGHGLAVAPLQAVEATAALVNGGFLLPITYLKRSEDEAKRYAKRVIKPETSEAMRYVMRVNAEKGTAKKADIPGYFVGGKTGTSEKVVGGRYSSEKVMTTFMAAMPVDQPKYLIMVMFDEPKGLPETHGYQTAGWNAAPTTGKIIERVGPMLDLTPRFAAPVQPFPYVARLGLKEPQ
jgi:cell division protein FtsI (penicillin-binding protein 3)